MYLFPAGVLGLIGQHKSPCRSSNGSLARYVVPLGNNFLHCLPSRHELHTSFSMLMFGMPSTSSFCIMAFRLSKLIWPSCECYLLDSFSVDAWRHVVGFITIWTLYNLFRDLPALTSNFLYWSCIINSSPLILMWHPAFVAYPKLIILLFRLEMKYTSVIFLESLFMSVKYIVPFLLMSLRESSPNRTFPMMVLSIREKYLRSPVIWLLAPLSRYHMFSPLVFVSYFSRRTFFSFKILLHTS